MAVASWAVYWEVVRRSFRRQLAYRTANLSGIVTNGVFGYLRAVVIISVYESRESLAGYPVQDILTFLWIGQALLMVVALWGWWDVEDTIRSGNVVMDLARPISFLGFWFARDLGRAAYYLLYRAVPMMVVAQIVFGVRWPERPVTWLLFAFAVFNAITISFGWRMLINLSAFWSSDARGLGIVSMAITTLFSGFLLPLSFFPPWLLLISQALPFSGIFQVPADVFLERMEGTALAWEIARQSLWSICMLAASEIVVRRATRRVTIKGG